MSTTKLRLVTPAAFLVGVLMVGPAAIATERAAPERSINVILLDHSADIVASKKVERNAWQVWKDRVPSFLGALEDVCGYRRSGVDVGDNDASLFSLLIAARLPAAERTRLIAQELKRVFTATGRPSCVLSRSTTGHDQLTIVFQDGRDYPPATAAKIVIELSNWSPPNCLDLFPNERGPFQPPPSIVMDYRSWGDSAGVPTQQRAKVRWGVLEHGYLLPQYILHTIAVLEESLVAGTKTFYRVSEAGPGTELTRAEKRTALMVFPGVGTDRGDAWKTFLNPPILALERAGRGGFATPLILRRIDNQTAREINDKTYAYATKAFADGMNPAVGLLPHTNKWGYAAPFNQDLRLDKQFARRAVPPVVAALQKAANEAAVKLNVDAICHSLGATMLTEGALAIKDFGTTPFNQITMQNGRVRMSQAGKLLENNIVKPGDLNILTNRWDAPALPGSVSNWRTIEQAALKNQGIKAYLVDSMRSPSWQETGNLLGMVKRHSATFTDSTADAKLNSVIGGKMGSLDTTIQDIWTGRSGASSKTFGLGKAVQTDMSRIIYDTFSRRSQIGSSQGGILFAVGNTYQLDLDAQAWCLIEESKHATPDGVFGVGDQTKKKVGIQIADPGWVPPLMVGKLKVASHDLVGPSIYALPVGLARLYHADVMGSATGRTGWTHEPCLVRSTSEESIPYAFGTSAETNVPHSLEFVERETGAKLGYNLSAWSAPSEIGNRPAILYEATDSMFQPDLATCADGSYFLLLRHGTVLRFDQDGRLTGATDRLGHGLRLVRRDGEVSIVECPDGRRLTLEYSGGAVTAVQQGEDQPMIQYRYATNRLRSVVVGDKTHEYDYDDQGVLTRVSSAHYPVVELHSDARSRLASFSSGSYAASIDYEDIEREAVFREKDERELSWKFGPRRNLLAVRYGDQNWVLFTRDPEDRLIQLAFAREIRVGERKRYVITQVLGAAE